MKYLHSIPCICRIHFCGMLVYWKIWREPDCFGVPNWKEKYSSTIHFYYQQVWVKKTSSFWYIRIWQLTNLRTSSQKIQIKPNKVYYIPWSVISILSALIEFAALWIALKDLEIWFLPLLLLSQPLHLGKVSCI